MTGIHNWLYAIAFMEGDRAAMQQHLDWAKGRPNEYAAFDWQTKAAAFAGQWRQSQGFAQHAIDLATRSNNEGQAARYAAEQALRAAVFGKVAQVKAMTLQSLALERDRSFLPSAALALALCGESAGTQTLVDELVKRYPKDMFVNDIWLPAIRGTLELQRGQARRAIEQLQPALHREAATELWPLYLRGLAFLRERSGDLAAAEFEKILKHRGQAPLSVLYPLAQLGLARALALKGDLANSRNAYSDFFALWKDADADLPVLIESKKEYARLK